MIFPFILKATSQVCAIRLRLLANLYFTALSVFCIDKLFKLYLIFTCCAIKSYKKFQDTQKKRKFCLKIFSFMFEAAKKKVSRQYKYRKKDIFLLLQDFFSLFFSLCSSICYCCALLFLLPKNYCLNLPRITYTRVRYYNHYYDVYVCRSFSCYIALIV